MPGWVTLDEPIPYVVAPPPLEARPKKESPSAWAKKMDQLYLAYGELSHDEKLLLEIGLNRAQEEFRQAISLDLGPRFWSRLEKSAQRAKISPLRFALNLEEKIYAGS